ncbi:MAG: hypothetical protein IKJ50_05170 [Clostridia bacterium]|nr:hypothetical protein [Clostridia bacterium]
MLKNIIHKNYVLVGQFYNILCRCWWNVRDKINKPNEKAILFIAHPDDDTLFFHKFIKEHKPYVVLLTDGWSLKRFKDFNKVMKIYGVRYRAFNLHSRDKRINLLEKYVIKSLKLGDFEICATHNAEGEYGHEMHIRVHEAVKKIVKCRLFVPALDKDIENFSLNENEIKEKTAIFNKYYKSELFVLDIYSKWVKNEKLIEVD